MGLATNRYAVLAPDFTGEEVLDVPVLKAKVYGTNLVGMFCAGNSNGLLVPYFTSDHEVGELEKFCSQHGAEVARLGGKYTALGNLIACNDRGAYVSRHIRDLDTIRDTLGVEVTVGDVGGHSEVGAHLLATNKGFIAHPDAEDRLDELKDVFGAAGMVGTVNFGVPYVKAGLIANSRGYITGTRTTGIELQRIDDALGFMD